MVKVVRAKKKRVRRENGGRKRVLRWWCCGREEGLFFIDGSPRILAPIRFPLGKKKTLLPSTFFFGFTIHAGPRVLSWAGVLHWVSVKHFEGLELAYGIDFVVGLLINLDLGCNAVTKVYFASCHM